MAQFSPLKTISRPEFFSWLMHGSCEQLFYFFPLWPPAFFSKVQQILSVACVLHAPTAAQCTLTISQMDLQRDDFWVPVEKGKNHNQKHERLLYLRQSLSLCSPSGWSIQPLQCSVILGTQHTPKRSIYGSRIPAAWSRKGIISQWYSGWWICRCCLCIPIATSPLSKEL